MKFRKWIEAKGGPRAVSRLLKLSDSTVYKWLACEVSPTAKRMIDLVKLGKGQFTYEDIIKETKKGKR